MTLDEDVARLLSREVRRSGSSFKEAVNQYLRLGLNAAKQPVRKPFVVEPFELDLPASLNYDNIGELLEILEGPEHR